MEVYNFNMEFLKSNTFFVVDAFSVLTVIGQIIIAVLLVVLAKDHFTGTASKLTKLVSKNSLLLMLIVALAATLGSLFFSEISGWTPCKDCWLQRIVMYPQVVLLSIAVWRHDKEVAKYIVALSVIGILIAINHYWKQVEAAFFPMTEVDGVMVPCDASGVSCAATQIKFTFGYITLPMMALTAFVLNLLGSIVLIRTPHKL